MLKQNFHFDFENCKNYRPISDQLLRRWKSRHCHAGWNGRSTKSGAIICHRLTPEIGHPKVSAAQ
jgi:hypothetical protein